MKVVEADKIIKKLVSDCPFVIDTKSYDSIWGIPIIEAIPFEWLKSHLPNIDDYILMKGYPMFDEDHPLNTAYDKGYSNGWKACCKAIVTDLLADWEEENSN